MEWHLGFGEFIGTAALALSALALWLRYLDRRERVRSQRRARVSAQPKGDGSIWIVNNGPADARNVRISVGQNGLVGTESFIEGVFPIQTLSAGSRLAQQLAVRVYGRPQTADITLTWDDDGEDGREWQSNVPLF